MKPKTAAQSGTFESSDVIFLIEPLPDGSGRKLEISSTVMQQFGDSFKLIVTNRHGLPHNKITLKVLETLRV